MTHNTLHYQHKKVNEKQFMMCTYHSWQRSMIQNEVTSNSKEILVGGQPVNIKSHGIEIMYENVRILGHCCA